MQQIYKDIRNEQIKKACQQFSDSCSSPEAARAWLDAHLNDGEGHMHERDGIICPICHNQGLIYRRSENGELLSRECSCMEERRRVRRERSSGAPRDSKSKCFDNFQTSEPYQQRMKSSAMQYVQDVINGSNDWFYIGGQPGSGKTHLLKSIYNVLNVEIRPSVRYMSWRDETATLKAMLNSDGYKPYFDRFKTASILFVDDFLKTRRKADGTYAMPTDGDINIAFDLVRYRDENNLLTVFSSEFSIDAIHGFDQSTGGRIKAKCGRYCLMVKTEKGRDYRIEQP